MWAARRWHTLVTAVNEATGEVKYVVTNAVGICDEPVRMLIEQIVNVGMSSRSRRKRLTSKRTCQSAVPTRHWILCTHTVTDI